MVNRKTLLLIIAGIFSLVALCLGVAYSLFFTERGLSFFAKSALSRYTESEKVEIGKIVGSLPHAVSFQDISLENLKYAPPGSLLEIKKLDISVNPFRIEESNLNIHNGRLNIPGSDPVLFHGAYRDSLLDFNLYSKNIDIRWISAFFRSPALGGAEGTLDNADIYIKGRLFEPELSGGFHIERFERRGFFVFDCPVSLALTLKNITAHLEVYGDMSLERGEIKGPKTATVKLQPGRISFNGRPDEPVFSLKGVADVEGIRISIELKGTPENPDLRLSSEPSLPRGMLLLMLATNKSWKGVTGVLNKGEFSPDIAGEFIDYFFFAGSGSRIARYFGISDMFFKYDSSGKGIGVKKDIGLKTEVSYEIERPQGDTDKPAITHKIGSEVKVLKGVSVEAERELKENPEAVKPEDKTQTIDKVLLKYKKEF